METQLPTTSQIAPVQPSNLPAKVQIYEMNPAQQINHATEIATHLKDVIVKQGLAIKMGKSEHVTIEGWEICGMFFGVMPRERHVKRFEDGSYEAAVDLIATGTGKIVGGGSALCSRRESRWRNADEYAVRSMAITRATGKAYRIAFSWVIKLAGYNPTPAEEMPVEAEVVEPRKAQPTPTIYTGTTEQQQVVQTRCQAAKIPEDRWEDVHNKLMNKPSTELKAVIKEVLDAIPEEQSASAE